MALIIAVDPGYNYTGVACLSSTGFEADEFSDPVLAYNWVKDSYQIDTKVLVEDYNHGGVFTKEAKETLRVIGLFDYGLAAHFGYRPTMVNKNRRLPFVTPAKESLQLAYGIYMKDAVAALAHAMAEREYGSQGKG